MKKFYATPTVEFTGFDVEDVITVSIQTVLENPTTEAIAEVMGKVEATGIRQNYDKSVHYNSYSW